MYYVVFIFRLTTCSPSGEEDQQNSTAVNSLDEQVKNMSLTDKPPPPTCASVASCITPDNSFSGPFYPAGYVSVIEEPNGLDSGREYHHAKTLLRKYEHENSSVSMQQCIKDKSGDRKRNGATGHSPSEGYERSTPKHGDLAFMKFQKRLAKFPQQIMR